MLRGMDDQRIGQALRAIRVRKRLRQSDVALLASVPRQDVIAIEAGRLAGIDWGRIGAVAQAMDASIRAEVRWQGADLDRLLAQGHPALHEGIGALFARLAGWATLSEVSFGIFGERGVIDILAWHAPTRSLLIVELKTALGDPQALVATMDRRVRLGRRIAAERGWAAESVSAWVVFADSRTNRRHVARHTGLLRGRFPTDGRAMRVWLASPTGTVMALSFWTDVAHPDRIGTPATTRRVRPRELERRMAPTTRPDVAMVRR
jgi:transcriptional regulator with XRE-family HTH domain